MRHFLLKVKKVQKSRTNKKVFNLHRLDKSFKNRFDNAT